MARFYLLALYWEHEFLLNRYADSMNNWHLDKDKKEDWFRVSNFYRDVILFKREELSFEKIRFFVREIKP